MTLRRRDEESSVNRRRRLAAGAVSAIGLAALVFGAGPVVGDMLNGQPEPQASGPVATVVATQAQSTSSGSGLAGASVKTKVVYKNKPAILDSRISTEPVVTEEGKGSFVGLKCPKYFKAVAGGVLSRYINLVVSSSSPNNPVTEEFTPNTWWLAVTNINVDGQGGSLSWRGVVSCMKPLKLQQG